MKKLLVILALAVLLVPGVVMAQPPGCTWDADPAIRIGWSGVQAQKGIDYRNVLPGQTLAYTIRMQNAYANGVSGWVSCNADCDIVDTFCTHVSTRRGWTINCVEGLDVPYELPSCYVYDHHITIQAAGGCNATVGEKDTIIVSMVYTRTTDAVCAPECGDCMDPDWRGTGPLYNADTLIVTVVAPTNPITIVQDTLTLVDHGATQAYIPFTVGNAWACFTGFGYNIKSKGHVGGALDYTSTVTVPGGQTRPVYGILDASEAAICTYDTLTIIVWSLAGPTIWYDTCVQRVHIVEPVPVPLFTVPVVTILVLALILAAAVFMRRRAVSRA